MEKEFWQTQYFNMKEENEQLQKEMQIVKDVCKADLISYLETIRDTTSCEDTKKYTEVVIHSTQYEQRRQKNADMGE